MQAFAAFGPDFPKASEAWNLSSIGIEFVPSVRTSSGLLAASDARFAAPLPRKT